MERASTSNSPFCATAEAAQAARRTATERAGELTGLLQALVRIPSVNSSDGEPIDGEAAVAACLAEYLSEHGVASRTLAPANHPNRASLVAELDSGRPGPTLLLMSNLDVVVPGDAASWRHAPFSGDLTDGRVWGRGAIDCKMLVACQAFALAIMKNLGLPERGRVRMIAAADEETGGALGFGWLAEAHPDLLRADLAICEGGGATIGQLGDDARPCVSVGCGEKGRYGVMFEADGPGGHAATPWGKFNPIAPFGDLLCRIAQWRPRPRPASPVFEYLAPMLTRPGVGVPGDVEAMIAEAQKKIPDYVRSLRAQSRMTLTPTLMRAGEGSNVIPTRAVLTCDARLLPGQAESDLRTVVDALLAGLVGLSATIVEHAPPSRSPMDAALLARFEEAASEGAGRAVRAVPSWCTGATDAHWVRPLGTHVYGFQFLSPDSDPKLQGIHCVDESIDPPALLACSQALARFALGFLGPNA